MSRSGYYEDSCNEWQIICWRGAVQSAIRGKRGQAFFAELVTALDAMPEKKLVAGVLQDDNGSVCALGAVGKSRSLNMGGLDPEDSKQIAETFGIADALAREVVYENDEVGWGHETPEHRFTRIRNWAASNIISAVPPPDAPTAA